ncbi:MAG: HD domain-containing protein [Candidatus Methanomethylophilaceae archaeon]|jgi:putative hydrolase of HD superfamily|nr:HD domain-containing protein [Candidatus Methanomethylophilaceae archaeon]NLF33658.1 HD domain-containing protein [Thermoplasmatales archaeon]
MARALDTDLVYAFFDASNMHRWNDHLRPLDLTELDKQAHKAAIAWVIGKYEEDAGNRVDWRKLIEEAMFSFMQRIVLTDLKPELFHRMRKERAGDMNRYVLEEFSRRVPDMEPGLRSRFEAYLSAKVPSREGGIVGAAHYLATRWEFNLIYEHNRSMTGIGETRAAIEKGVKAHSGLIGVENILTDSTFGFVDLMGQLRFQQRWARTPRVPQTTVLGHSLMVALMTYLHDLDAGAGDRQVYNDFFTALFHDLPEVLTKDVVAPVKTSVGGLTELLDEYERELMESRMMPLIPEKWREEFRFMVYEPFTDRDDPILGPRRGRDIKCCDLMAAYIEAYVSRRYGITSRTLEDGEDSLRRRLNEIGGSIDSTGFMERLDRMRV